MKLCDCKNCLHRECCGGPQYGCIPAYTSEHYDDQSLLDDYDE